jgi:hypothetical protein
MIRDCGRFYNFGKSLDVAVFVLLLLSIFVLLQQETIEALVNNGVDTKDYNQTDMKGYVIKYLVTGGFTGGSDYVWYNSTNNHLLSNFKFNASLYDIGLSNALFDIQLSVSQQKNLSKLITDSNFFNISFNNDKPSCCDFSYFRLEVKTPDKITSVSWTSANIGDDPHYERIPSIITKIVETLAQYTTNSTLIFSESRMKN